MLEIYNETIRDLLLMGKSNGVDGGLTSGKQYQIKHDQSGNTTVSDLAVVDVCSMEEVSYLLRRAAQSRLEGDRGLRMVLKWRQRERDIWTWVEREYIVYWNGSFSGQWVGRRWTSSHQEATSCSLWEYLESMRSTLLTTILTMFISSIILGNDEAGYWSKGPRSSQSHWPGG